ncbi:Uncharacterised protein [Vibrio cholerae]|nr:Uncharacterised protein [Vibrio cholerae]
MAQLAFRATQNAQGNQQKPSRAPPLWPSPPLRCDLFVPITIESTLASAHHARRLSSYP